MNLHDVMMNMTDGLCPAPVDVLSFNFSEFEFARSTSTFKVFTTVEYAKIIVTVAVICAALVGNIGIILAVSINRGMRTTINLYLVNLAVADLFICTFCMTVYLINNLTEPLFILGPIVCKLNAFCQMTCLTSSVFTLSAISCDRFIAILYPLEARFRVTKQRTGIIIVIIWITSVLASLPFLFMRKHYEFKWRNFVETNCGESWPASVVYDPFTKSCITSHPSKKIYYTFVTIALFFVPIIVISAAYTCIAWKLWANVMPGEQSEANVNAQDRAKKKVIKMVCIMVVAFILCWAPLQLAVLYSQFWHSPQDGELPTWFAQASYLATFIAYSNSAFNPIIYGGFNQGFRDALINVFKCRGNETRANLMRAQPTTRTTVGSTVNYTVTGRAGRRIQENFVSELVEMKTIQIDEEEEENQNDESTPLPINQTDESKFQSK